MIENKQKILFTDLFRDFGDILGQIGQIEKIASVIKKNLKYLLPPKLCYSLPNALRRRILGREEGGGLHFQKLLNGAFFAPYLSKMALFLKHFPRIPFFQTSLPH